MADLSGHTPIYVRTTGDDDTGDGSLETPYASPQKAFDVAVATPSGNYVIDLGSGINDSITPGENWPSRIAIRGAGISQSIISINAYGDDAYYDYELDEEVPATAAKSLNITSDKTVYLGFVLTHGGAGSSGLTNADPTAGADVTLTDCRCQRIAAYGGANDFGTGGGAGGNVTLVNTNVDEFVEAYGGVGTTQVGVSGYSGDGGNVTMTDSTVGTGGIKAYGAHIPSPGDGGLYGGAGGDVTLTRSQCAGSIDCYGGNSGYIWYSDGGAGGAVSLTDSTCIGINCSGGYGSPDTTNGQCGQPYPNGANGAVTVLRSTATSTIYGGNVTVTDSTVSTIASDATITFVGNVVIPNQFSGNVVTTNLRKGRGVNGSSLLGIA